MNILVTYFSFSGNNERLAQHIAVQIGSCDIEPVVEAKRRTTLTIILDMMFKRKPRIKPATHIFSNYDHVIMVAPVWDSKVANPMKTLIRREKDALSDYSFISLCGYNRPEQKDALIKELTALAGHPPKTFSELKICDLLPENNKDNIKAISQYRVTSKDMAVFEPRIDAFLKDIAAK